MKFFPCFQASNTHWRDGMQSTSVKQITPILRFRHSMRPMLRADAGPWFLGSLWMITSMEVVVWIFKNCDTGIGELSSTITIKSGARTW